MARLDQVKEQIGLNKFIMGLISVMIFSMTGYVVSYYETLSLFLLVLLLFTIVALTYIFKIVFSKTISKIQILKDL